MGRLNDPAASCTEDAPESEGVIVSLKDRIQLLEQHLLEKVDLLSFLFYISFCDDGTL